MTKFTLVSELLHVDRYCPFKVGQGHKCVLFLLVVLLDLYDLRQPSQHTGCTAVECVFMN